MAKRVKLYKDKESDVIEVWDDSRLDKLLSKSYKVKEETSIKKLRKKK